MPPSSSEASSEASTSSTSSSPSSSEASSSSSSSHHSRFIVNPSLETNRRFAHERAYASVVAERAPEVVLRLVDDARALNRARVIDVDVECDDECDVQLASVVRKAMDDGRARARVARAREARRRYDERLARRGLERGVLREFFGDVALECVRAAQGGRRVSKDGDDDDDDDDQKDDDDGWRVRGYRFIASTTDRTVIDGALDDDHSSSYVWLREHDDVLRGATGASAWGAGFAFGAFVASCPEIAQRKTALELGSGCGFGAIALARARGARVIASDRDEETLENLRANVVANGLEARRDARDATFDVASDQFEVKDKCVVSIRAIDWDDVDDDLVQALRADVVVAADCAYDPTIVPALARALASFVFRTSSEEATRHGSYATCDASLDDLRAFFARHRAPLALCVAAVRQPETMELLRGELLARGLHCVDASEAFARVPGTYAHVIESDRRDAFRVFLCAGERFAIQ